MSFLSIENPPLSNLKPWARNARTHSKNQIKQIAESITQFGFTNPVLIDREKTILAGHGRVAAAKLLGLREVLCVRLEHMTKAQKRAYLLADNKLALNAGWNEELLVEELEAILGEDAGFDVSITGFWLAEVDSLIEGRAVEEDGDPADDLLPQEAPIRCKLGDIWQLGPHRLICGDALDPAVVEMLMDGNHARMVFTDPPYSVPIAGHVSGLGKVKHREFARASGEMSAYPKYARSNFPLLQGHRFFLC
jgi:ParB-like nuclease domain